MIELCQIALLALHPERNIRRAYRLSLGGDLFGDWTVELRYGACGAMWAGTADRLPQS